MSTGLIKRNYAETFTFISLLKGCTYKKDICGGIRLHAEILKKTGLLERSPFLASSLINMYAKCGLLAKAQQVLDDLPFGNVYTFNALISGYVHHGHVHEAFDCFQRMQNEGLSLDAITFISILKACSKAQILTKGKQIHGGIVLSGLLDKDIVLGTALIDMYVRCGEFAKAEQVIEELPVRDVVSWSALIGGYVRKGKAHEALLCFEKMQCEGLSPDVVTFVSLLKACGTIGDIEMGKKVHNEINNMGLLELNIVLGNSLVDMYVRCGVLVKAQEILKELPIRDVVSWNALISGYSHQKQCRQAFNCFEQMQSEGLVPDVVTFISLLKACGITGAMGEGKKLHEEIVNRGLLEKNIILGNALVDMYMKCGMCVQAQEVFEGLPVRDVISWNVLIAGYTQQGEVHEGLNCFQCMQIEGLSPDMVTFICISKACGITRDIEMGKRIHETIVNRSLLKKDIGVGNALIDMYAKCDALIEAHQVLEELPIRNVISWSALIAGYAQHGRGHEALNCFEQMQNEGLFPDIITFLSTLKSCGSIGEIDKGKQIHNTIVCSGLLEKDITLGNALVDMYGKCGMLEKAHLVLEGIPFRNIVSWNALITGYVQQGRCHEALNVFGLMQSEGFSPDAITYLCALKACGSTGSIDNGNHIHDQVVTEKLLEKGTVLGNALVDMYVKCGLLAKAREVLEVLPIRNLVTWSTLVLGYAQSSLGHEALNCLERMEVEGIVPDEVILLGVLSACSHSGLLDEAQIIFRNMIGVYEVTPSLEHHICMVMIFGFAGQFDKAMSVINMMPFSDYPAVWLALLSTCGKWGNLKLGRLAFHHVIILDKSCTPAYVLMANIFVAVGMHEESENVEAMGLKYVVKLLRKKTICISGSRNLSSFSINE